MSFCPFCGEKNTEDSRFCANCGKPLTEFTPEEQAPAQEPVNTPFEEPDYQSPTQEEIPYYNPDYSVGQNATYNEGTYQPPVKKKSKTPLIVAVAVIAILLVAAAALIFTHTICIFHEYSDATCEEAAACVYCDSVGEEALGHDFAEATCTVPKTCKRCNKTEGDVKPHSWKEATCVAPKICSDCNVAMGDALGHDWQGESCTEAGICGRCGEKGTEPQGHVDGEWVVDKKATLMNGGTENLYCANCDAILDVRIVDARDPAVDGATFNFTEDEFVEWAEGYLGFTMNYSSYDEDYEFSTAGNEYSGYIAFECDENGNVAAIGVLADDPSVSIGVAMAIAGSLDPLFTFDDEAILAVYNGDYYTDALMTIAYAEEEGLHATVLAPDEWYYE